ncbi:MAG: type III-B CRISPR module RAMP protein Cmr6 [Xanthomonadales bacterium]|jgi:CRISPR-associated protein Cmr6|nr:type III-B CRISPR module RAMP protein Cmr6 [Xanthomonadales bacterium]
MAALVAADGCRLGRRLIRENIMTIAAVPGYLQTAYNTLVDAAAVTTAQRFGLLFPAWNQQWNKETATRDVWTRTCVWGGPAKEFVAAFNRRQRMLAVTLGDGAFQLPAVSSSPFTTGLGNEHPLENGFAFLNPYGVPYLAGSGVKGVLRRAAQELMELEDSAWKHAPAGSVQISKTERLTLSALEVLFGREPGKNETEHVRGVLSFWDVVPEIEGKKLRVDVMTPHQSHYYFDKRDPKSGNSVSPHDSGQPNPITFLTMPPGSKFGFTVVCDLPRLERLAPELHRDDRWKALVSECLHYAFDWLGFGAKTAVGYGAMRLDEAAVIRAEAQATQARLAAEEALQTPERRKVNKYCADMQAKAAIPSFRKEQQNQRLHQEASKLRDAALAWTNAEDRQAAGEAIETWAPKVIDIRANDLKDFLKKLKVNQLKGLS